MDKSIGILGAVIISIFLVLAFSFDLLSYPEYKLEDAIYQNPSGRSPEIVVIGIDEYSLEKFGRFSEWSRQLMADAINILNSGEEKPAVIAIDILYAEESKDTAGDESLTTAAKNGDNVVVASMADFGDVLGEYGIVNAVTGHETPYKALSQHASYGAANGTVDSDGLVRSATFKMDFLGETIYSFPVEVAAKFLGLSPEELTLKGEAYIPFYGKPGDFTDGIFFADIFDQEFEPDFFAGSIVFIGPYAPGMMDSYYTPADTKTQMYGVEIHANAAQMIIERNFKAYASMSLNIAILVGIIALSILAASFLDIRIHLVAAVLLSGTVFGAGIWLYNKGVIIKLLYPVFSIVILYTYKLVYGYVMETLEKQRVKSAFKKYVDPSLVDKLMETGEANSDAVGVKKDIAVLFVDVRGFTPMSEALRGEPEMIVKILNEYLELTSSCIFNNGGSVDKFIGDATMALFNGFVPLEDYVFKAVKAAFEIVEGASGVNASIKEKYGVDVGFGIGVNCGEAIVGNLGPAFRKDYTAIGDVVNTAARLESNAKRSQVLISANVYNLIKDRVTAESVGNIPLKGKTIPLEVFSVTSIGGGKAQ